MTEESRRGRKVKKYVLSESRRRGVKAARKEER